MGYKVALIWSSVSISGSTPAGQAPSNTLSQAQRLAEGLTQRGHEALLVQADQNLTDFLVREKPDVAIPLIQGDDALTGDVPLLLEALRIPYAGSSARMTRLVADRTNLQPALDVAALNAPSTAKVPETLVLGAGTVLRLGAANASMVEKRFGQSYPLCVKPAIAAPGSGVWRAESSEYLVTAMIKVAETGGPVLIQRWVEGLRLSVGIFTVEGEPEALPSVYYPAQGANTEPADSQNASGLVSSTSKNGRPTLLSDDVIASLGYSSFDGLQAERDALDAFYACGARDMAQVDLIVDGPVSRVLRVDTSPSLEEGSVLDIGSRAMGFTVSDAAESLVSAALDRG